MSPASPHEVGQKEVNALNRNVTIVVIILIIVLMAGYLVWLRGKYLTPNSDTQTTEQASISPTVQPTPTQTVVASPTASASATIKPSAKASPTKAPLKTASPSAKLK